MDSRAKNSLLQRQHLNFAITGRAKSSYSAVAIKAEGEYFMALGRDQNFLGTRHLLIYNRGNQIARSVFIATVKAAQPCRLLGLGI